MNAILLTVVCWISVPKEAHAYLDPGTGSYILQLIIAGLFAGLFAIKNFWRNIRTFFSEFFLNRKKEGKGND